MKQLSCFQDQPSEQSAHHFVAYIDGASRNNPGQSGIGIYIQRDGEVYLQKGFYVGIKTNNQAEYLALIVALIALQKLYRTGDTVHIISDSLLLVKQIAGQYRIRNPELQKLYAVAYVLRSQVHASVSHVLREHNKHADLLANKGIDEHINIPQTLLTQLDIYGITI